MTVDLLMGENVQLEKMKDILDKSKADVLRDALRSLMFFWNKSREGYTIWLKKDGEEQQVPLYAALGSSTPRLDDTYDPS